VCRTSPRSICSISRRRASRTARSLAKPRFVVCVPSLRRYMNASACPRPSGRRTRRRCAHGGRYRPGGRRGKPRRVPRQKPAPRSRSQTAEHDVALRRRASAPPSRLDKSSRSRARPSRCHEGQVDVQDGRICHMTTVRPPPHGRNVCHASMKKAPTCGAFPMRPRRLELPRTNRSTRPSTLRVYQFRHRRVGGQYSRGEGPENRSMSGGFCPLRR
jgi:hypothetical protein